tara:strand:- start:1771 stop:2058 length:288 start_codon:yes stop_codon:yes gene_type:complete
MGKKNRKEKKEPELKSMEDRKIEITEVIKQINDIGFSTSVDGVKQFYTICSDYIKTGEGKSGKIKLEGFKREIEYILPTKKQNMVKVNLAYNKDV